MIQYVEKLFQETKTIILPDLGALTITNPDTKEMMFMPFLKHDDGALAGFIEKEAGISNDEARKMVTQEIQGILGELEAGKKVAFGAFGHFLKDADGDMAFENLSEAKKSEPVAPAASQVKEKPEPKPEPKSEPTPKEDKSTAAKKDTSDEPSAPKEKKKKDPTPPVVPSEEKKTAEKASSKTEAISETNTKPIEPKKKKKISEKKETSTETLAASKVPTEKKPEDEKPKDKTKEDSTVKVAATTSGKTIAEEIAEAEKAKKSKPEAKDPIKSAPVEAKSTSKPVEAKPKNEQNILQKEEIAANQKKLNDLKKQKEAPKKKRKRGAGFYILMVLIVLLIGGGTYVGIFYDDVKEYIPFLADNSAAKSDSDEEMSKMKEMVGDEASENEEAPTESEDSSPTNENESANTEDVETTSTEEDSQPVEATSPPAPVVSGSNNQPFHIVAGVFGSAENADRLAEKIRGMGYPAKTFKNNSGSTVVSVQSYATAAEAQAALATTKDAAPKGWVLKWQN